MLKAIRKNKFTGEISRLITNALAEDIKGGDITTDSLIPGKKRIQAKIICKESNVVVCGIAVVREIFRAIDKNIRFKTRIKDGDRIDKMSVVCLIEGPARGILKGERTALNLLGRLSGIATLTHQLVKRIQRTGVKILDTRKTTPGLRILEKYAVRTGGGYNHRFGLFDQVLIKDNHLKILKLDYNGDFGIIIQKARSKTKNKKIIEVEVRDFKELESALKTSADVILLDNMKPQQLKKAVALRNKLNGKIKLEASGNINQTNILNIARCGVDFISLGMLTHSVKCVDFSLKVV